MTRCSKAFALWYAGFEALEKDDGPEAVAESWRLSDFHPTVASAITLAPRSKRCGDGPTIPGKPLPIGSMIGDGSPLSEFLRWPRTWHRPALLPGHPR
jgi:hypothetical protein